jgi:group I intron endonuclease
MIGYIYYITNTKNGKKYIGKTVDINRRISRHFADLRANRHHSIKLQRAFNKYGDSAFIVKVQEYQDVTEEDLSLLEMQEIKKYDSYYNGYNETLGGEGHSTLFDFNTTVLLYQIGQRYDGVIHKIAKHYNCDRTTIKAIFQRTSLDKVEYDKTQLENLIKQFGITDDYLKENYVNNYSRQLSSSDIFKILSALKYSNISQSECAKLYNVSKDVVNKMIVGKTYKEDVEQFNVFNDEQTYKLFVDFCNEHKREDLMGNKKKEKVVITQEIVDFILDNKDAMTQKALGEQMGLDRKRVARIIHKQTYKNLVEDWEKRHS